MKTKVLNVITVIEDGGLERHVFYINKYRNNSDIEHKVVVLTSPNKNDLTEKYKNQGIDLTYFGFQNKDLNLKAHLKNFIKVFRLAKFIKKNDINILHSHDFFPGFFSRIAAIVAFIFYFHKVKHIYITLHIVFFWLSSIHHMINRLLGLFTTNVICLSYAILNYSLKTDKLPREKYEIINTGIDTTQFIPDTGIRDKYINEFGLEHNDIVIGNIGVLSVRKGQIYLLNAVKLLIAEFPNIKLLIFGSEREHELEIRDEIFEFIRINGLERNIRIIKPREDINLIYNLFDIFVMPSITEGLSACSIEALLMEKICLFSDIEPFKELVEDKKNGFLFENKSVNDLTEKLRYIINNLDSLNEIKQNARKSAEGKYDVRNMVQKYESLYLK